MISSAPPATTSANAADTAHQPTFMPVSASGPLTNYVPDPRTGVPPITDPMAGLPLPPDMTGLLPRTDPCVEGPGVYHSINLRGRDCRLAPG